MASMTSKVAKLHALFDNSWAFHVLRFWSSRDAEKASNKGFCEETATVAKVQMIFEMPWGVKLWGFVGCFCDFSMRSFAAFAAASMNAFCWAKRWVKAARFHVLLAKSWARNSPIDLQKSWKVEGHDGVIWWGVSMILPNLTFLSSQKQKHIFLHMLRLGIPKILTLLDTSNHGWHLSKKTLKSQSLNCFNSASRRGGQWSPAKKWRWPSSIAALQSTMQDLKAPVQDRWEIDRYLPESCYIPKWMRSKTVRFLSL